jgi:transposase
MVGEDKTRRILSDWLGCKISVGTVHSIIKECAEKSEPHVEGIKANLKKSGVIRCDETGVRIGGKTGWFHIVSDAENVIYTASAKRGKEGSDESGILENYTGTIVHDCWQPYFRYNQCAHALCNAHILRELKGILQNNPEQTWSRDLTNLLLEMKSVKERYETRDKTELSKYCKDKFNNKYSEIIEAAKAQNPRAETKKQSKAYNLVARLEKYRDEFCRFIADFDVSFDNNMAERDVRPLKVKTKVSGGFRTEDGARNHATIASVVQTVVKRGKSVLTEIVGIVSGKNQETTAST